VPRTGQNRLTRETAGNGRCWFRGAGPGPDHTPEIGTRNLCKKPGTPAPSARVSPANRTPCHALRTTARLHIARDATETEIEIDIEVTEPNRFTHLSQIRPIYTWNETQPFDEAGSRARSGLYLYIERDMKPFDEAGSRARSGLNPYIERDIKPCDGPGSRARSGLNLYI